MVSASLFIIIPSAQIKDRCLPLVLLGSSAILQHGENNAKPKLGTSHCPLSCAAGREGRRRQKQPQLHPTPCQWLGKSHSSQSARLPRAGCICMHHRR